VATGSAFQDDERIMSSLPQHHLGDISQLQMSRDRHSGSDAAGKVGRFLENARPRAFDLGIPPVHAQTPGQAQWRIRPSDRMHDSERHLPGSRLGGGPLQSIPALVLAADGNKDRTRISAKKQIGSSRPGSSTGATGIWRRHGWLTGR
jgi:hypothetical protein